MPYRLVGDLFFIRVLRKPHRFNIFLGLPVGMLASFGIAAMRRGRPLRWKSALPIGVVGALILGEYCMVPYRTARPMTPAWYGQLAEEPGRFAVLDLPMAPQFFDKQYMFYQITHGKPLVEGHVSRLPREALAFLDSTPFLQGLRRGNVMDPALVDVTHQLRSLAEVDVRYVILHKGLATPEQLTAWQDWLTFEPHHEDEDLVVYRTEPNLGREFALVHKMTDEIGLIRLYRLPHETAQADLIQIDARWGSTASPSRDYDACLKLVNAQGQIAQTDCRALCPTWPTSRWETNEVVRGSYALRVNPSVKSGVYTLTLALADGATDAQVGYPVTVGALNIRTLPHVSVEPKPARPLHARWGDVILLGGYDLQVSAKSLELTLYWQAEQRMDVSYKVFVHLIDPTTGAIVAQDDAVPRRWMYPTTRWEPGEVVEDTIPLSLDGVSPGQYHLALGLYDPHTGQRLPAYSADGERYPDNAVPLTTVQR
jgi:hypothetical protein